MKITLTAWFSLLTTLCHAQGLEGTVSGIDASGKKESLIGAVVVWEGTRSGTVTDESGEFRIGIPPNAKRLIVSFVGFENDTIEYIGQTWLDVLLQQKMNTSQVEVEGEIGATHITMRNPLNFQVLNEKELCKAACCNLSESFETNASIDAAFSDAITGTRQIRMLGLDGRYTQMMFDNIPSVRGLASTYGLTYVPGPWVKSIYIAKGIGSVTSGFESITGQINVAIKNPVNSERFHLNAYAGSGGRTEINLLFNPSKRHDSEEDQAKSHSTGVHFHPIFLAHGALSQLRTDMNEDGFLDNPLFSNIILRNEWHLETNSGLGGQYVINYLRMKNVSGTMQYDPADEVKSQLWGVDVTTDRYDFSGKTGYVFEEKPWKSFGSQLSMSWHNQQGKYGYRRYIGQQLSGRANLLFASRIINDDHKFTTGLSYVYDDFTENITYGEIPPMNLSSHQLNRKEMVPGMFFEYTMNLKDKLVVVAGLREDFHNTYGALFTPRLHTRYSLSDNTTIKLASGIGYRTANVLMDNVGILAGNRNIIIEGNDSTGIHGLDMEKAWNSGLILTHKFRINYRDATISLDAYRTTFINQVVQDSEQPTLVRFYNLEGKSFSNSVQGEFQWSPIKRLEWRLAYRWLEVRTQYTSGMLERPLVNKHRAFTNLAYETKEKKNGAQWRFDATVQWISRKRLPYSGVHLHEEEFHSGSYSEDYWQVMAQVTYVFRKNVELYLGGENLTNFMVHDAIASAENPASEYFDGSLVWGPVFGRMGYIGLRWIVD